MSHSTEQLVPTTTKESSSVGRALIAVALVSAVAMSAAGMLGHSKDAVASDAAIAAPLAASVQATAGTDASVPAASEVILRVEPAIEDPVPTF